MLVQAGIQEALFGGWLALGFLQIMSPTSRNPGHSMVGVQSRSAVFMVPQQAQHSKDVQPQTILGKLFGCILGITALGYH